MISRPSGFIQKTVLDAGGMLERNASDDIGLLESSQNGIGLKKNTYPVFRWI